MQRQQLPDQQVARRQDQKRSLQMNMNQNIVQQQQQFNNIQPQQQFFNIQPQQQFNNIQPQQQFNNMYLQQIQSQMPYIKQQNNAQFEAQIYNDDEEIVVKELNKTKEGKMEIEGVKEPVKSDTQNIEKQIKFQLTSMNKAMNLSSKNSQNIPAMLTLKAEENLLQNEKTGEVQFSRANVDLICVIDRSGSMGGQKIQEVKNTLKYIVDFLGENDRICLIQFDHEAQRILPFKRVTKQNKQLIIDQCESINSNGGTNILRGMEKAVKAIVDRKYRNQVTSVFLLSDGQTSQPQECKQFLDKQQFQDGNCFTVHSFGFGNDHDPVLMNDIATIKDGNFYYVQDIDKVDEMFVDALGGLFSVVAQNLKIRVQLNDEFAFLKGAKISKTYGDMWKKVDNNTYEIQIVQLISGVSKDFMLELEVPATKYQLQDFERNPVLLKAALHFEHEFENSLRQVIQKNAELELTVYNEEEIIPDEVQKVDEDVEFNYLRVRGAEVIKECMNFAEKGQYTQGQNALLQMQNDIQRAKPKNQERLQMLHKDLETNKQQCNSNVYHQQGKFQMINNNRAYMKQQARPQMVNQDNLFDAMQYQNCQQQQMSMQTQQRKVLKR